MLAATGPLLQSLSEEGVPNGLRTTRRRRKTSEETLPPLPPVEEGHFREVKTEVFLFPMERVPAHLPQPHTQQLFGLDADCAEALRASNSPQDRSISGPGSQTPSHRSTSSNSRKPSAPVSTRTRPATICASRDP